MQRMEMLCDSRVLDTLILLFDIFVKDGESILEMINERWDGNLKSWCNKTPSVTIPAEVTFMTLFMIHTDYIVSKLAQRMSIQVVLLCSD